MEKLPAEDGYETEFVKTLLETGEVVIPYFKAVTFVESIDKTGDYIMNLIENNDLSKIGEAYILFCGRYTYEDGNHYWVRMWRPREDK